MKIPFNKASITEIERKYINDALNGSICGDSKYTKLVHSWFKERFNSDFLLTTSCSTALDMGAMLANLGENDEFIVPSYTFVSSANCGVLRNAKPVFVDIDEQTMNIDPSKLEEAITAKTKLIIVVHYAGVACDMDPIMEIAHKHNILVMEDAAQAVGAYYKGKVLGTIGDYGTYSFHETKNYCMGEGGALICKNNDDFLKAEIIREKGTDRSQFLKGMVDKYSWQSVGSSYLPSDILAALLYGQFERFDEIMDKRVKAWEIYYDALKELAEKELLRLPIIPDYATNNAHMSYLIMNSDRERDDLMHFLKENGVTAPFHYIPLHLSPMGAKYGYKNGDLPVTEDMASRLIRLPMYADISEDELGYTIDLVKKKVLK